MNMSTMRDMSNDMLLSWARDLYQICRMSAVEAQFCMQKVSSGVSRCRMRDKVDYLLQCLHEGQVVQELESALRDRAIIQTAKGNQDAATKLTRAQESLREILFWTEDLEYMQKQVFGHHQTVTRSEISGLDNPRPAVAARPKQVRFTIPDTLSVDGLSDIELETQIQGLLTCGSRISDDIVNLTRSMKEYPNTIPQVPEAMACMEKIRSHALDIVGIHLPRLHDFLVELRKRKENCSNQDQACRLQKLDQDLQLLRCRLKGFKAVRRLEESERQGIEPKSVRI